MSVKIITYGKKVASLACALSVLGPVSARTPYFNTGFLAGAHLGYSHGNGSFTNTYFEDLNGSFTGTFKGTNNRPLVGFLAGYHHLFTNNFTGGLEVSINFSGADELRKQFLQASSLFTSRMKRNVNVIPAVTVGKVISDQFHLAFGLGAAITRFTQQIDNVEGLAEKNVSKKNSRVRIGIVPFVRGEYACTPKLSLTGTVGYEIYSKVNSKFGGDLAPELPAPLNFSYNTSIKPKFLTFKIGLVLKV